MKLFEFAIEGLDVPGIEVQKETIIKKSIEYYSFYRYIPLRFEFLL